MELGPIFRAMTRNKTRVALLTLEIAFTAAIVLNCFNLILDQRAALTRDTGIDEENLIAVRANTWGEDYSELQFRWQVLDRDLDALRALPGVIDATATSNFPLQGGGSSFQVKPLGAPDTDLVRSPVYTVDPHFIETLDLELVEGSSFTREDLPIEAGPRIMNIIVTRDLAEALFPDGSAVGQTIDTGSEEYPDVIVGVVDEMFTPYGGGPMETRITFYPGRPARASGMQYLVRAEPGAREEVMGSIEETLLALQSQRVLEVMTLTEVKTGGFFLSHFLVKVLTSIIVLLLFVTALGIFGMTSFAVAQRKKQVGTRRALGATRPAILRLFLLESTLIAGLGLGLGLVGAYGLNVLLVSKVDSTPLGTGLVVAGVGSILVLSLAATLVPAIRAASVSPAFATRSV